MNILKKNSMITSPNETSRFREAMRVTARIYGG
jgi:hypothetical protein